ncbi:hypothetical protein KUTeg_020237 [Tegillarca granosa]|uniref:Uncharacterized protein n=1 Tax=Tegillarca granosa TaxID=220873 RepID=A0ABQ9E7V8_TEGGR|nr:hypothetical protein KUTeg_020237 [Tegillarca granosa]
MEKNCTDERNRDKNNEDGKFDCSKCIDKKQPVSPCQIHKNKVHIQVEVHTSPKCSRHLLFKKDNKSEDDLKSSNDTDENESIRASRRTRSSISKIKSDHVTNSNNKELHLNNLSTSTERKRNKKAETHGVLKIQETSKEACDVDQNPKCLPDKSKEAIGNTEKVTESIEKSPNKSSARKYRSDLTKSNNERETESTTVKKCLGQDINKHFSKQATRKSASDLTNIGNENETEFTLIKDKYSPRKSASDLTGMNTEREMQFTLETDYLNKDIETESVAKHSCNLYKILKDSPSKSPFKDKYMFSFSSPRNDKVHINKCAEESPTEISPKLNVLFPKTDSPVKFSLRRDIMSPGETSPQKFSSKASILSPGTKSPGKFLSKRDVLSPGANSPSKKSFKADVLSPGVNSPSKKSFKANLLSPGANSPSKKSLKADILSPTVNSPSKKSLKADILSPRVNSPSKKSSKTNLLSPGTNPPSNTSFKAHGTNSPSKTLANTHKIKSPGTKSPHKILSPRRAGLSCSPLRQHKLVKTGDITWNIVDDSESETDLNDSLINKITKSIDKFESDEDEVIFSDFKKTWPVLSSQSSTKSERYGKTDDSTLESETESNCSFGSDISNVVPETAPIKLQKTDYFVSRRSHSRSKCKEDKCAKLRNKRKHATTGGNQESKRRRIN